jgi:PTS system cellobiose-specific IIC component
MMLPFIVVPVLIVTINYVVFSIAGTCTGCITTLSGPFGVDGFVATGEGFRGSLVQFFDLAVPAPIYYPFFKAWEPVLVAGEEALVQVEESRMRTPVAVG